MIILIAIDRQYAGFSAWRTSSGWRITIGYIAVTYAAKSEDVFIEAMHRAIDDLEVVR